MKEPINRHTVNIKSAVNDEYHIQNNLKKVRNKYSPAFLDRTILVQSKIDIQEYEKDIIKLICDGLTSLEIAKIMDLSKKSVEGIKEILYLKTGTINEKQLVHFAFRNGIIH